MLESKPRSMAACSKTTWSHCTPTGRKKTQEETGGKRVDSKENKERHGKTGKRSMAQYRNHMMQYDAGGPGSDESGEYSWHFVAQCCQIVPSGVVCAEIDAVVKHPIFHFKKIPRQSQPTSGSHSLTDASQNHSETTSNEIAWNPNCVNLDLPGFRGSFNDCTLYHKVSPIRKLRFMMRNVSPSSIWIDKHRLAEFLGGPPPPKWKSSIENGLANGTAHKSTSTQGVNILLPNSHQDQHFRHWSPGIAFTIPYFS